MATIEELEKRIDNLTAIVANIVHVDQEGLIKEVKGEQTKENIAVANIRKHI